MIGGGRPRGQQAARGGRRRARDQRRPRAVHVRHVGCTVRREPGDTTQAARTAQATHPTYTPGTSRALSTLYAVTILTNAHY